MKNMNTDKRKTEVKSVVTTMNIKDCIYSIRGVQVMLDRDLADMYGVETRVLNQAVKRNAKRFPSEFMFQLTNEEIENWISQIVISNKEIMGLRKAPYAFTEAGVSMLSAVLKSETAIEISIKIIQTFVEMRRFIASNSLLFQRLDRIEIDQLSYKIETDEKFEEVFNTLEERSISPKQGLFYDGQVFDAYSLLAEKHNSQYEPIEIRNLKTSHDRFLIIDEKTIYHFGASLKDLGKKWFARRTL